MDDVTKSLNVTLAQTLADGHCFLHAVALQLETPNTMQAYEFLMKAIETESRINKNHYTNFNDENSGRLDLLVHKYLHNKIFYHAAGDLISQITSNALQKPIHIYISLQEIRRILYSLKNTKAVGHDNISLQYIKDSFNVTAPLLHLIINTSIATNKFPDPWKHSIIKPLHKAGDINTASNYRPISLLPVLSKILEKVIFNQLSTHLHKSNLLHPNQYAYRKYTSTQDALLNVTEKIYSDIDNKNVTLLLLLDLSKAFDSVEHERLLQKISNLGIATQWFQSYLANRSHAVKLENTISSPIQNDFGVPQGSILGPLLFSIFIIDFPSMPSNTRISMYADDVQIAMTSAPAKLSQTKTNAEILLKHVKSCYDQNALKLNASKTQFIIFGSKNTIKKLPNLTLLGNDIIEPVGKVKNLGVWFDQNMSFTSHVEKTCSKINGTLMFLHRVKNMLDEKTRLLAIQSLVLSRFDYCDLVWGVIPKGLQKELQKCMNFAAKLVCKGNFRKNYQATPLMKKLNWTPI
ncbi:Reverse transcriptase domain [Trinorchestia longiramus]|nr:Reverse transcriptase domain [Trinorchestia longiramus]